jgi:hypothetical protein
MSRITTAHGRGKDGRALPRDASGKAPVGIALALLAAIAVIGLLALAIGGPTAGAALAGAVCGGTIGAWAGGKIGTPKKEDDVAYTIVTHERPGWHSVDLRDEDSIR